MPSDPSQRGDHAQASNWQLLIPFSLNATGFAFLETAIVPAMPLIQRQFHASDPTSSALLESANLVVPRRCSKSIRTLLGSTFIYAEGTLERAGRVVNLKVERAAQMAL